MSSWIFNTEAVKVMTLALRNELYAIRLPDTSLLLEALKAFRFNNVAQFKSSLDRMDEEYPKQAERPPETGSMWWDLCRTLATTAL
jgi:hypothetical protein